MAEENVNISSVNPSDVFRNFAFALRDGRPFRESMSTYYRAVFTEDVKAEIDMKRLTLMKKRATEAIDSASALAAVRRHLLDEVEKKRDDSEHNVTLHPKLLEYLAKFTELQEEEERQRNVQNIVVSDEKMV